MSQYALDPADEFPHTPTPEPNFNESVYMNAFDPVRRMGGWMRLGNRVNEAYAELSVCLYLPDGRIACQFQRPAIADNRSFDAGGLSVTVGEALQRVEMQYAGELLVLDDPALLRTPKRLFSEAKRVPGLVRWQHTGTSPVHGGVPTDPQQQTLYGRDFSLGHFNQHTRVSGEIRVGDEHWPVAGCGWRDHSWGPRYWTNIYFYRLFIGNFGPDRGMMVLKITDRQGVTRRCGVLQFDGDYEEITDLDVLTEWTANKDPRVVRLGVRTARRAVRIDGEIRTLVPLRNRRTEGERSFESRIAEGFTQWSWGDRQGCGMTEYIEVIENGQPVGFPL